MNALFYFPPSMLVFLGVVIFLVLLLDVGIRNSALAKRLVVTLSILSLIILAAWMGCLYPDMRHIFLEGHFIWDPLAVLLSMSSILLSILVFIYAYADAKLGNDYYLLSLFSLLGALVLISAGSMLSLYLGLALTSLPLYAMVAQTRGQVGQAEAAMKYIIMGAVASAFLLYGLSLFYSVNPSLIFHDLSNVQVAQPASLIKIGIVLLAIAMAFKLGAAPFHFWVPDVYQVAPITVVAFMSTVPKIAIIGIIVRFTLDNFPILLVNWTRLFLVIALLSVIVGNLMALVQIHIRRLLAYSSIAHMGYALLGVVAKASSGTMAVFYIISYALMAAAAFGVLTVLNAAGCSVEKLEDLNGLSTRSPWLAFILSLVVFSMMGIPPFLGFFAKFSLLQALVIDQKFVVAGIALLFSVVGAYYYLNIIKIIYFNSNGISTNALRISNKSAYGAVSFNAILLLFLGLFPDYLITICRQVVPSVA
jgi:NADH-quinone oxidoreductase subunit N